MMKNQNERKITIKGGIFRKSNGLFLDEDKMVSLFIKDFDPKLIANLLRSEKDISQALLNFVADILEGKVKPKSGQKKSTQLRDEKLHFIIEMELAKGKPLRSRREVDGAAYIAAKKLNIKGEDPEETAVKAYQRIQKEIDRNGLATYPETHGYASYVSPKNPDIWKDQIKLRIRKNLL